jgi:hypothetical protein
MPKKIQLGSAPKTFQHKVVFPLVEGGEGEIVVDYQYRTRAQFAAFISEVYPDIKTGRAAPSGPGFDVVETAEQQMASDVKHILGAVKAWDLSDEFNSASVRRLVDEYPAASAAIITGYRDAITEGRTKN